MAVASDHYSVASLRQAPSFAGASVGRQDNREPQAAEYPKQNIIRIAVG